MPAPIKATVIGSHLLNAARELWIDTPNADTGKDCFVLLDAELYRSRVKAPDLLNDAIDARTLAAATCIYLSAPTPEDRHRDFTCSEIYADFLADELQPWIENTMGHHKRYFVVGLSLSGLQAAFTVLRYPRTFAGALCQSPSAWWNDEWLADELKAPLPNQKRFWISVGDKEIQEGMTHPPSGLLQNVSQLDSCRRLAAKLSACGADVRFSEFAGGHDPQCWGEELPAALSWLLRPSDGNP